MWIATLPYGIGTEVWTIERGFGSAKKKWIIWKKKVQGYYWELDGCRKIITDDYHRYYDADVTDSEQEAIAECELRNNSKVRLLYE